MNTLFWSKKKGLTVISTESPPQVEVSFTKDDGLTVVSTEPAVVVQEPVVEKPAVVQQVVEKPTVVQQVVEKPAVVVQQVVEKPTVVVQQIVEKPAVVVQQVVEKLTVENPTTVTFTPNNGVTVISTVAPILSRPRRRNYVPLDVITRQSTETYETENDSALINCMVGFIVLFGFVFFIILLLSLAIH